MARTDPTEAPTSTVVPALQSALAGEHAAIYGYGILGAHLRGAARTRARAAYDEHRARRDRLQQLLVERQATPVAASAAYRLPRPVATPADARSLATELEERLAAVWLDAVADLRDELRELAAQALQEVATRAAAWRGGSVPFPGLSEQEH